MTVFCYGSHNEILKFQRCGKCSTVRLFGNSDLNPQKRLTSLDDTIELASVLMLAIKVAIKRARLPWKHRRGSCEEK